MKLIQTEQSQASAGHYTPAVIHGDTAYISGQLPLDAEQGETSPTGTIREQTQKALRNLERVLLLCKSRKELVVKTTIYIPDIALWPEVNEVYAAFFGSHRPARSIVPTNALHFGSLIEIEAIAAIE